MQKMAEEQGVGWAVADRQGEHGPMACMYTRASSICMYVMDLRVLKLHY